MLVKLIINKVSEILPQASPENPIGLMNQTSQNQMRGIMLKIVLIPDGLAQLENGLLALKIKYVNLQAHLTQLQ